MGGLKVEEEEEEEEDEKERAGLDVTGRQDIVRE